MSDLEDTNKIRVDPFLCKYVAPSLGMPRFFRFTTILKNQINYVTLQSFFLPFWQIQLFHTQLEFINLSSLYSESVAVTYVLSSVPHIFHDHFKQVVCFKNVTDQLQISFLFFLFSFKVFTRYFVLEGCTFTAEHNFFISVLSCQQTLENGTK